MRHTIKLVIVCLVFCGAAFGQQSAIPLPDKVAPEEVGEISCHVQQESQKNADGTMATNWRPWLRAIRPDGTVWSQKAKVFKNQADATTECQSWAEIASHLRSLHQMKLEHKKTLDAHEQRMREIEGAAQGRINDVERSANTQINDLQKKIAHLEKQLTELLAVPEIGVLLEKNRKKSEKHD